jgi:DNA mismatch repair ATPase MutS
LWSTQLALAIESWRVAYGDRLASWLAAAGEFEALCALAGYAYERPADAFPEILDSGRLFDATALGHPLLPEDRCVRNDVRIGDGCRALVVSGSNMSGKSTLLRSIGTNAVLALAGAPVCARRLSLSPLSIGASIRVNDSLQQGTSRFYAEIKRLYQIVELAREPRPVLFLLDEVLHGTNSHDRRIGAEAVVRGLLEHGAVGLLTTHDLELAKIADQGQGEVANVHFEDHLEDGEIRFDYRLRSGVVRKSNALELMRAVGLEV